MLNRIQVYIYIYIYWRSKGSEYPPLHVGLTPGPESDLKVLSHGVQLESMGNWPKRDREVKCLYHINAAKRDTQKIKHRRNALSTRTKKKLGVSRKRGTNVYHRESVRLMHVFKLV